MIHIYWSDSCRFYSPYVHCLPIQTLTIHLFLRLLTCARLIKWNMSHPLGAGHKSMPWDRPWCLLQLIKNLHPFLLLFKPSLLSVILPWWGIGMTQVRLWFCILIILLLWIKWVGNPPLSLSPNLPDVLLFCSRL